MAEPAWREPAVREGRLYGLLAEFSDPEALVVAARRSREAGFRQVDAFSPFPIEDLTEALDLRDRRVPRLTLAGGCLGAATGYGMQVYTNLDYPLDVGGRGLLPVPAFMLITFEFTLLFAVIAAIGSMLALNRLPRLNHPVFAAPSFARVSMDRFCLVISSHDRLFDPTRTRAFLQDLQPNGVEDVPFAEEPA